MALVTFGIPPNPVFQTVTITGTGMTVADGFALTSAGSIALTAGGVNKNIGFTASGTGVVQVLSPGGVNPAELQAVGNAAATQTAQFRAKISDANASILFQTTNIANHGPRMVAQSDTQRWDMGFSTGNTNIESWSFRNGTLAYTALEFLPGANANILFAPNGTGVVTSSTGFYGGAATTITGVNILANSTSTVGGLFWALRDNGTTNAALNDVIGSYDFACRLNGGPNSIGSIRGIYKGDGTTRTGAITFNVRNAGVLVGAMQIGQRGDIQHSPQSATALAPWGTTGALFTQGASTTTDPTSSGTVPTAVANSWATPVFAASSATTFTNAANLYIAGDVAAGTNVTLTNTYGLWNVGKTRLDGRVYVGTATGTNLLVGTATNSSNGSIQLADHTTSAGGIGFGAGSNSLYTSASGTLFWNGNKITAARAADTTQTLTIDGGDGSGVYLTAAGTKNFFITGAAGNMTITAGTGVSRTLTLQTTTAGSTATNALVLNSTQDATLGGSLTTAAPNGGTAGAWKMGIRVAAATVLDTTQYIQLDVGGTLYKLALAA